MYAVGIDIGTTTISAVVYDKTMDSEVRSYTIQNGSDLRSSLVFERIQDPGMIVGRVMGLLEDIRTEYPDIVAIGLTGQMHGILYVNKEGEHISNLYTWQDESGDQKEFCGKSICELVSETSDVHVSTGYGLVTHLYHLRKNRVPKNTHKLCTIADYVGMRLTGRKEPLVHISNAASLGFFDISCNCFESDLLKRMGVDTENLPVITSLCEIQGFYHGIPVSVAIGDNQASFLGSIEHPEKDILVNMGTGGQISVLSDREYSSGIIETRPFDGEKYLLVGASLCGGRAYAVLAEFYLKIAKSLGCAECDPYLLMNQFLENGTEMNGLTVSTLFAGTRKDPSARGSIENIGIHNFTPEALTEGVIRGMADELHEMYEEILEGISLKDGTTGWSGMVASGNGFRKNPHLRRAFEKQFGMPLQLSKTAEEASIGAVKAALRAIHE